MTEVANNTSSTYWNSMDFDSEGTLSTKNSSTPRKYVDPWDLENYAYIRKRLDSHNMSSTPSAAGEPQEASFYYTPFDKDYEMYKRTADTDKSMHYAGHDEYTFMNDRFDSSNYYHQPYSEKEEIYGLTPDYSDMDDVSEGGNPLVTDGSLLYMYETATRCRKMAVPRTTSRSDNKYNNDYYGSYIDDQYSTRYSVYSPLEDIYYGSNERTIPIYDDIKMNKSKPGNFGLSNYGHLKIDYSFSWNSLDRFIGK